MPKREPYWLPDGFQLPPDFDQTMNRRTWFYIQGVRDAIDGQPMLSASALRLTIGDQAWDAYQQGYKAGGEFQSNQEQERQS